MFNLNFNMLLPANRTMGNGSQLLHVFLRRVAHVIFTIYFLWTPSLKAQQFEYTPNCELAYQSFIAMKLEEGRRYLEQEKKENPGNELVTLMANYEDFISLTFNENPKVYQQKKSNLDQRLRKISSADKSSPYYLFSKALLYYQWAIIRTKYADYWNAAWDFRRSYLLFAENKKKYPNFTSQNAFWGSQQAIVSTIPSGYKWVSSILGLNGNMKSGMSLIENQCKSPQRAFKEEAYIIHIYLKNYLLNQSEEAYQLIKQYKLDTKSNQLFCFMAANLALNNKKAAETEQIITSRKKGNEYMSFPMLDYELADAKLRRLDYSAIEDYLRYIKSTQSNFYIKDALLSISYAYHLQGNEEKAKFYLQKVKINGKTDADADKQAQKIAEKGILPDKDLLRARLLNDGGYHEQALQILLKKNSKELVTLSEKLEYHYRLARIYDDLKQWDKALQYYQITIRDGKNQTDYYAARSALQAGYIMENQRHTAQALAYFEQVIAMENHEYKNSLDQRAKAAINRIKEK